MKRLEKLLSSNDFQETQGQPLRENSALQTCSPKFCDRLLQK